MLVKAALNGARGKEENQNLPHSIEEIEREVRELFNHGYKVFHIHCYDENGKESLMAKDVERLVISVKNISNEIQIGISSGEWIEPDLEKRMDNIRSWKVIPDFISVNMIEENAIDISKLLISKGVLVEAGLNEKRAAEIFAESNLREGCCRILIEPEPEEFEIGLQVINEIEEVLNRGKITIPRLLHGFNKVCWDFIREAKRRGYESRAGMEDTIFLENGDKVKSNLEIMKYVEQII